jgi:hypothetical protein
MEMSEKCDAEGLLEKYANVETTVVYFDRPNVIRSSLRCAAKYLKEHPASEMGQIVSRAAMEAAKPKS